MTAVIVYAIYKGKRQEHMATTNTTIDSAALQNIASLYNNTDPSFTNLTVSSDLEVGENVDVKGDVDVGGNVEVEGGLKVGTDIYSCSSDNDDNCEITDGIISNPAMWVGVQSHNGDTAFELGRNTDNATFIDFHTSTAGPDYDARILAKTDKNLEYIAGGGTHKFNGEICIGDECLDNSDIQQLLHITSTDKGYTKHADQDFKGCNIDNEHSNRSLEGCREICGLNRASIGFVYKPTTRQCWCKWGSSDCYKEPVTGLDFYEKKNTQSYQ